MSTGEATKSVKIYLDEFLVKCFAFFTIMPVMVS